MIKKTLAITSIAILVATISVAATMTMVQAGEDIFDKEKVDPCDDLQIKFGKDTCTFQLIYIGPSALIVDSVPAEWEVTEFIDVNGNCVISDKKGSKNRGATAILCDATSDSVDLTVTIETVLTKNLKWWKPTFCGLLPLNDGAFALDPNTFEVFAQTDPLTATTQDLTDEDGDGVVECLAGVIVDLCPEEFAETVDGCPNG